VEILDLPLVETGGRDRRETLVFLLFTPLYDSPSLSLSSRPSTPRPPRRLRVVSFVQGLVLILASARRGKLSLGTSKPLYESRRL